MEGLADERQVASAPGQEGSRDRNPIEERRTPAAWQAGLAGLDGPDGPLLIVLLLLFMAGGFYLLRDLHTALVVGEICHRGCKTWESNWWAMFWETVSLCMLLFFDLGLVCGGVDGLIRMAKGGGRS